MRGSGLLQTQRVRDPQSLRPRKGLRSELGVAPCECEFNRFSDLWLNRRHPPPLPRIGNSHVYSPCRLNLLEFLNHKRLDLGGSGV